MDDKVKQLVGRKYGGGTMVLNCVSHMQMSILERPTDCNLCNTDVKNALARCHRINEFLNDWKDDAVGILALNEEGG